MPSLARPNPVSEAVFNYTMQTPGIGMNERLSQFRNAPPRLQGMNLSTPPTGGFSLTRPSIIVGADASGAQFNTRMPPVFAVPELHDKRVLVGSADPLTHIETETDETGTGRHPSQSVYRRADFKFRHPSGASTVARTQQEAARAAKKYNPHRALRSVIGALSAPQTPAPPSVLAGAGVGAGADADAGADCDCTVTGTQLAKNALHPPLSWDDFVHSMREFFGHGAAMSLNTSLYFNVILAVLFLAFFIATICVAAQLSACK